MKVIFFYAGTPPPVLESELELICKHEKSGDSVLVLQCNGGLANCHWNLDHDDYQCGVCRSRFKNGWEYLDPAKNVELKQFSTAAQLNVDLPTVFDSVDAISSYRHDGENIGYGVTASLVSIFRDHRFDTVKHRVEVNRTLATAVQVYEELKREISEFEPDRIYFFNGRIATHLPAKLLAKKFGIEFFSFEVSQRTNCYRLLENKTVHDVTSVDEVNQVKSSWTVESEIKAANLFEQRRSGRAPGKMPVYTLDQRIGVLPRDFNPGKRNIAIFNSTLDEYIGIENAKNKLYKPDDTEGIACILESFKSARRFFFYLRVHPHMKDLPVTASQLSDIYKLVQRYDNIHVIGPAEEIDSYALMDACEKVISFGSTIGIEATYWGKPSILADRAIFQNFNYAYTPASHDELVKLLHDDLKPLPSQNSAHIIISGTFDSIPFEYFREIKVKNRLTMVTLQGVSIKADLLPRLWHWIHQFPARAKRVLMKPSLILDKLAIR